MATRWQVALTLWTLFTSTIGETNLPPAFVEYMDNLPLSESTSLGEVVYTLKGRDPEGLPVKYGLVGTDRFSVNPVSGEITLVKPLDREINDTMKFLVSIEDQVPGGQHNLVRVPFTIIVLDENDNAPYFKNSPYEIDVPEDEKTGATILRDILVEDKDSVGDNLEVGCVDNPQWHDACDTFDVVTLLSSADQFKGALVLRRPLDYNDKQFYQFKLYASDGRQNSTAHVEVKVEDVQNSPPVFSGPMAAALAEDAPVGSLVTTIKARDADRAHPRPIYYDLITNPLDFFVLDSSTGELRTAKPLDREALTDPSSPLNLTVQAREIVNGQPVSSELTMTRATLAVTIKDVNDEPPRFNRPEYSVEIPENLPLGTPIPNLDMTVTDTDLGSNAVFGLRLSDEWGAFVVEPTRATGSAAVTLRLNDTLDYEDPNRRKFILVVIAEELHTSPRLSSKATVTVTVTDVNDNAPQFTDEVYYAKLVENAAPGTRVTTITATDRDQGRYGTEGIVYQLSGNGAELFRVDNRTGDVTVAPCATPGRAPCLDIETRRDYLLHYKATDDDGAGQTTVVSLQVTLLDANDNPPACATNAYRAAIDEDATKFEPELQVQARDDDQTSEIRYSIVDPEDSAFWIDPLTGKVGVKLESRVEMGPDNNHVILTVLATDGVHNTTCTVDIAIRDVNNHAPIFDAPRYDATVLEDAPIGTEVAQVLASDLDRGVNAEIKYSIQKGALDAFVVNNETGLVAVSSKLDYDKRNTYRINIIASDKGMPSLTGTTELVVQVINVNDKTPYFTPQIQRAEVSADAEIGTMVHTLIAMDPDINSNDELKFELSATKLVKAVDRSGKEVTDEGIFDNWFSVWPNGSVVVSRRPDRTRAAVLTLPVIVTDTSATALQQADGELIVTIVDVNRHAPVFPQSQYTERLSEEQPVGTVLGTYTATDKETPIAYYEIRPPNAFFRIDNVTGVVKSSQRIDYEKIRRIEFNVIAYDSGVPQLFGTANILVEILNINDEEPVFDTNNYEGRVLENSKEGTLVVTVHASDADEGQYGEIRYSLSGEHASLFTIDNVNGDVRVARGAAIDREAMGELWLQAIAVDNAPDNMRHMTRVPIHITIEDANDNAPMFTQKVYKGTIAENLRLDPPAVILQVLAEDRDIGLNGQIKYEIIEQSDPGAFRVDESTGIIYPSKPVVGNTTHHLTVTATDQAGRGRGAHTDVAKVDIYVASVNKHKPVFVVPSTPQHIIEIPENAAQADLLVLTVNATDEDMGENGRISYHLKVDNENVQETQEFTIDERSGELRTKTFLDREHSASYQLVIVARDHGSPGQLEALVFLTILVQDTNDNVPHFAKELYEFSVSENQPSGIVVGSLKAQDKDTGEHGKVYYHIVDGNQDGAFVLDRTQGFLRANISFDREKRAEYILTVYASNDPIVERPVDVLEFVEQRANGSSFEHARSVARVAVTILDENDNEPKFDKKVYYAGVKYTARLNEPIITVTARDDDFEENGTLNYVVAASNLYKFGDQKSSGSIVPAPFNITQEGVVTTANFMSEYNQDRFVLELAAQEAAAPRRRAVALVHVWVISGAQTVRMVLSRACSLAERARAELERRVSAATGAIVVAHALRQHVRDGRLHEHWCEVELHAVETRSQQALAAETALALVDARYDQLRDLYRDVGVETVVAATSPNRAREEFDPALAALIALLIVLFTGLVTFIVVCACLKHWVVSPPSMESSKGDSLARRRILDELSTTENPLWLENKLRPYEEQELTMNVFGEQNAENANNENNEQPAVDNPYATIQGRGGAERCGEYATLGRDSPTPLEAALGFQVCDGNSLAINGGINGKTCQGVIDTAPPEDKLANLHVQQEITQLKFEVEDLKEKLETLRVKRSEDREKLRELERVRLQLEQANEFKAEIMESQAQLQRDLQRAKHEVREAQEALEAHNDVTYRIRKAERASPKRDWRVPRGAHDPLEDKRPF